MTMIVIIIKREASKILIDYIHVRWTREEAKKKRWALKDEIRKVNMLQWLLLTKSLFRKVEANAAAVTEIIRGLVSHMLTLAKSEMLWIY